LKFDQGLAEMLLYAYGMPADDSSLPSGSGSDSTKRCLGKRKRNFTDFYKKRNKVYDETRDGAIVVPDDSRSKTGEEKLQEFRERISEKHPNAIVLNAFKIKCGICKEIKTLSIPYGSRNFDRHVSTQHGVRDERQRLMSNFFA
jgi:hypothetical protein